MSCFNQPNMERKNCAWITNYEKLSEMYIVPHVETKSLFTFQPIKRLVSTTLKSASLLPRFEYSFKGPKTDNYVVWWFHCSARKTSRDYEKPSPFLKNFLRQSQPSTSEPEPKMGKTSPNIE